MEWRNLPNLKLLHLLQTIFKQPLFGCKVCHCKGDTVHVCFGGTVFFASGFGPRKEGLADTHGIAFTVHKGQKFPQQLCNRVDATLEEVHEKRERERGEGWRKENEKIGRANWLAE
jgi:hypothetical protein